MADSMENLTFKGLVAFCILMENGRGIMSKAPDYVKEKFATALQGEDLMIGRLDQANLEKFRQYMERWNGVGGCDGKIEKVA